MHWKTPAILSQPQGINSVGIEQYQKSQCTCSICHNTPFRTEMCTSLFSMCIWDMGRMHCVICELSQLGHLRSKISKRVVLDLTMQHNRNSHYIVVTATSVLLLKLSFPLRYIHIWYITLQIECPGSATGRIKDDSLMGIHSTWIHQN